MNDIERKALELVNEHSIYKDYTFNTVGTHVAFIALCRAIEQHEAFRQEVSDAVVADVTQQIKHQANPQFRTNIVRFIITKPDPLVEVLQEAYGQLGEGYDNKRAELIRAALAKRGLAIVPTEQISTKGV